MRGQSRHVGTGNKFTEIMSGEKEQHCLCELSYFYPITDRWNQVESNVKD